MIDAYKQQWALTYQKSPDDVPTWKDLVPYIGKALDGEWTNGVLPCPEGGVYTLGKVSELPTCSIGGSHHAI